MITKNPKVMKKVISFRKVVQYWIIVILFFSTIVTLKVDAAIPDSLKVVFPFSVTNVELHYYVPGNGNDSSLMNNLTRTNEYTIVIPDNASTFVFNISYDIPLFNIIRYWITATRGGIIYAKVYINNTLLNNTFTIDNDHNGLNISVSINSNGSIIPFYNDTHQHIQIDDRIPAEVHHRIGYKKTNPGPDYKYVLGWMALITNNDIIDTSEIEVDYLKVYGRNNGNLTLLRSDDYNSFDTVNDGGLYSRYPFFPEGFDQHEPMPATTQAGILKFYPTQNIKKVWHWWNSNWYYLTTSYDSYRLVCKIRIQGHSLVQGGIDFRQDYTNPNTTYELGVSNWYFENNGQWQDVVFDSDSVYPQVGIKKIINSNTVDCNYDRQNRQLIFTISMKNSDEVSIKLYNLEGKEIQTVFSGSLQSGKQIIKSNPILIDQLVLYEVSINKERLSGKRIIY